MSSINSDEIKSKTYNIYNLIDKAKWDEALKLSLEVFRPNEKNCRVATAYLQVLSSIALWDVPQHNIGRVLKLVMQSTMEELGKDDGSVYIHPNTSTYFPFDRMQLKRISKKYYETRYPDTGYSYFTSPSSQVEGLQIRVGVLSSSFKHCNLGYTLQAWIKTNYELKTKVLIICISTDANDQTHTDNSMRAQFEKYSHEYHTLYPSAPNFEPLDKNEMAIRIRRLGLHILIHTNGHSNPVEMDALAQKPVPVIMNFAFASPGSIGSPCHDYIIVDSTVAPFPSCVCDYTEKVVHVSPTYVFDGQLEAYPQFKFSKTLYSSKGKSIHINGAFPIPGLTLTQIDAIWTAYKNNEPRYKLNKMSFWNGQTNQTKANALTLFKLKHNYVFTTRAEFGLPDQSVVFAFFSSFLSLNTETFELWIKVLEKVPNSVLWLCEYPKKGFENISKYVQATHSEEMAKRLISTPFSSNREFQLRRNGLANCFLDSTPRGGQLSTLDAIAVNVPVLTIYGDTPCGRVTASMLHSLGLDELIAKSPAEFVKLATNLGNDPQRLSKLSNKIVNVKTSSPLWNEDHYATEMAIILKKIWNRHNNGKLPIHVPAPSKFSSDRIKSFDVQLDNKIGHGSNGIVYKGTFRGRQVAVKKISPVDIESKYIFSELEIHKQLDHPAILKLLAAFADKDAYLVTELCGTNIEMIIKKSKLSETNASRFAIQLILGVEYLHSLNIIHRDIKASNCLIDMKGNLKICDFDNAIKCICFGTYNSTTLSILPELQAPEVILNREYSFASDVFASGATIVYFYTGTKLNMLTNGRKLMKSMQHLTTFFQISKMLNEAPISRPSCKELSNDVKFYTLAKVDRSGVFNDDPQKSSTVATLITINDPEPVYMDPLKLEEHCLVMQYYQYDDIKNRMREGVDQLKSGDNIVVTTGYLYGEEGMIIEIIEKMANIKFKVSKRMKPGHFEKLLPIWMLKLN